MKLTRVAAFGLLFIGSVSCSKCSKHPTGDADAAVDAAVVGTVVDAAVAEPVAVVDDAGAEAPAPTASGTTATAKGASGGPFAGSYKCMNGFTVTQNGSQVTGINVSKSSFGATTHTYSCTVSKPDECNGMYTAVQTFTDKKKPSKEIEKRKFYIHRREDGLAVRMDSSSESTWCKRL